MAKDNNIQDFLTDVADAIREKKGTTDLINPQDFSSEIASIQSGGDIWGFDTIGYTPRNSPIAERIEYSAEQKRRFESGEITNFQNDSKLVFAPLLDMTTKSMKNMYRSCANLVSVKFEGTQEVTIMDNAFNGCTSLKLIENLSTPKNTVFGGMFFGCYCLEKIEIDMSSATAMGNIFYAANRLRYILIRNIGKSSATTFDFFTASVWGINADYSPNARQSLIDSLITYSYDRASNGMATATIKLSANTKALLTEEEIAQITAKGFTIA